MIWLALFGAFFLGFVVGSVAGIEGMRMIARGEIDLIRKRLIMEQLGWPKVAEILQRARKELC